MRKALVLSVVVLLLLWNARSPREVGGRAPTYLVPPTDTAAARAIADSLFLRRGAPVDTLVYVAPRELRVVLAPGAFLRPARFDGERCVLSELPVAAMRSVALDAYRQLRSRRPFDRVSVRVAGDLAVSGSGTSQRTCRLGRGTWYFYRAELDSLLAAGGPSG